MSRFALLLGPEKAILGICERVYQGFIYEDGTYECIRSRQAYPDGGTSIEGLRCAKGFLMHLNSGAAAIYEVR